MQTLIALLSSTLFAQTVQFEEASLKFSPPRNGDAAQPKYSIMTPGKVAISNVTLRFLVGSAYRIATDRVSGEDWISSVRYDLNAIYPPAVPRDQVHEMIKALLIERMGLAAHIVQKELPTYALIVDKRGAKLKPATVEDAPGKGSGYNGHITGKAIPISSLATMIKNYLGREVVDMTHLDGRYDIDLTWAAVPADDASNTGPSIFTTLTEQLGLQLRAQKSMLDCLVVDRVLKEPLEN